MEIRRVIAGLRAFSVVAMLAVGMTLGIATPAPAEATLPHATPVCGTDQLESDGSWAVPPQQERPGEPY